MAITVKSQFLVGAPSAGGHVANKTYADLKKTEAIAYIDQAIATLADAGTNYDQLSELLALINANDGTAASVLATKLSLSGGTMTGAIVLAGDAANALEATTLQQVQSLLSDAAVALNASIDAVAADLASLATTVTTNAATAATATATVATNLSTLTSTVSTNATTAASDTAAVASDVAALTTTVSTNASTAATATATVATDLSTLTSTVSTNASTAASATAAVASDVAALTTTVASNATTASTATAAVATDLDVLEATVASLTSTVGTPVGKYAVTITGDASATDFVITHNLGNQDVMVTVRQNGSPKGTVLVNFEVTSNNVITVKFDTAPASGEAYRVVVLG